MTARRNIHKNPWGIFGIGAVLVLLTAGVSGLFIHESIPTRVGVVVVGDPILVFSYDQARNTLTAVRIPSDVSVEVTRGYGTYPLSSVWKLDTIDKRRGMVLTETLEEAIGIPIRFFIEPTTLNGERDGTNIMKHALSVSSFIATILDNRRTNIPPWLFIQMSRALNTMTPSDMALFDLENRSVFEEGTIADGTPVKKIDSGKLSLLLGTYAEDAEIRKENLRISVLNSTNTPGLAQKITRIMEGLGFHVRSLANIDTMKPSQCVIQGKEESQKTHTVQTLKWLYACTFEVDSQESQSDVNFIIGTDFEKRFLPF